MLHQIERMNLAQVEMLNQRGGRTLSIVDLMRAGTISPEMAAWCFCAVQAGSSFLTAANPGGAGKSTLMGALLAFLPPCEKLRTVGLHASRVPRGHSDHGKECLVCHEIGQGAYFGYLWGGEARLFFNASARGVRVATNLHADTMDEVKATLQGLAIGVDDGCLRRIGFVAFMACRRRSQETMRRVASLHGACPGGHIALWEWEESDDRFLWLPDGPPETTLPCGQAELYGDATAFMRWLEKDGPSDYGEVRKAVIEFTQAIA